MPELPEVQTVVTTLHPRIVGRRITQVIIGRPDVIRPPGTDLPAHLTGRRFTDVSRRGKKIVLSLDDGNRLYVHLGMTGRLTIAPHDASIAKHTHVTIEFDAPREHLRFVDARRFGGVWWIG